MYGLTRKLRIDHPSPLIYCYVMGFFQGIAEN